MTSSISISKRGNRIRMTGNFANEFWKSLGGATTTTLYIFHRDKGFYPLELADDAEAIKNAQCNPGTVKVTDGITNRVVWKLKGFKSVAIWPTGVGIHITESSDTHDTRDQAEAVCKMLRDQGFGGDGKIFPIETHVEEV